MKKHTKEPDFIGGQGSLTKEEELKLSLYFAKKKERANKSVRKPSNISNSTKIISVS